MGEWVDRTWHVFGLLTAVSPTHKMLSSGRKMPAWDCRCECGKTVTCMTVNLTKGKHRSCGCDRLRLFREARPTHGQSKTLLYGVWAQMRQRCQSEYAPNYRFYGGRGIKVCERWQEFENFAADMGSRPNGMTLDRIDPEGDYTPENCRWETRQKQANNKRNNAMMTANGKTQTVSEWARDIGVPAGRLSLRRRRGWTDDRAINDRVDGRTTRWAKP